MNKETIKKIILLLAILGLFFLFKSCMTPKQNSFVSSPTTFDSGKEGYRAFYLLLNKMGYFTSRYEYEANELNKKNPECLVILRPYGRFFDMEEALETYEWMAEGSAILVADEGQNPVLNMLTVSIKVSPSIEGNEIHVFQNSPYIKNVGTIISNSNTRFVIPPPESHPFDILLEDERGVICAMTQIGEGRIIILSDPSILNNSNIDRKDNVLFATQLISLLDAEEIVFNEAVHGYVHYTGNFKLSPVAVMILIQLAVALFLFYLVFMVRFGRPRATSGNGIRESVEYIHSLAVLFQKAKAYNFLIEKNIYGIKRRLGKMFGITPDVSEKRWIDTLIGINREAGEKTLKIIENYRKLKDKKEINEKEILKASAEIEMLAGKYSR